MKSYKGGRPYLLEGRVREVVAEEQDGGGEETGGERQEETKILFSTVISFWFGQRGMRKIREAMNGKS